MRNETALRSAFPTAMRWAGVAIAATLAAPSSALAQLHYESVFDHYRSFRDKPPHIDWRVANRTAGELGGFLGQTRASGPASAARSDAVTPGPSYAPMTGVAEMLSRFSPTRDATTGANRAPGEMMPMHGAKGAAEPQR
ncbi:MAG: hypothetical protein KJZ83_21525 [Burkholderiaceae bacterium]|nr:hypothetical protein [Burkholderiaceae bacterium]